MSTKIKNEMIEYYKSLLENCPEKTILEMFEETLYVFETHLSDKEILTMMDTSTRLMAVKINKEILELLAKEKGLGSVTKEDAYNCTYELFEKWGFII
jgi:hypothetical protein